MVYINDFNEKDLITLLVKDDEDAFDKLYHLYSGRLMGFLIRLVKSENHACELLQDTFIKVWDNRHNIDPEQSFRSYLFRIAENGVYDFYRKVARDKRLQAELINIASCQYLHVEESFSNKENVQFLRNAMDALPAKRRQVFQLIKMEERSYEEVSVMLNISTSTVSDHIVKATKFIRKQSKGWHASVIGIVTFFL